MRKFQASIIVLVLASLFLTACSQNSTPTVEPTAVPTVRPTQAGVPTTCTVLDSLLPQVAKDQQPPLAAVSETDHKIGPDNAKMTIIEYSDFQCPYCSQLAPTLTQFQLDHPEDVQHVFRNFPLTSIHDKANSAAYAAEAAGNQGKFWEMHDVIFANQDTWAAGTVEEFDTWVKDQAKALDLNTKQFEADYTSQATIDKVAEDYRIATEDLALSGTPTIFLVIDGNIYGGPGDYDTLNGILKLIDLDKNRYTTCPPMVIDPAKQYTATLKTDLGDIEIELFADKAPLTVNTFVFLAREGWFDNTIFHRVISGFVAQGGDPTGSGFGGPGYEYSNEISDLTFDEAGLVGMANSGADTNGSQFFITYDALPDLTGSYTIFGKVTKGMDIATQFVPRDASTAQQTGERLPEGTKILSVTISEK